jgi:hypothetical protein
MNLKHDNLGGFFFRIASRAPASNDGRLIETSRAGGDAYPEAPDAPSDLETARPDSCLTTRSDLSKGSSHWPSYGLSSAGIRSDEPQTISPVNSPQYEICRRAIVFSPDGKTLRLSLAPGKSVKTTEF